MFKCNLYLFHTASMEDLQNISGGKAELQPEAISDIGVLASKKEPPAGYYIVSLHLLNMWAIWKRTSINRNIIGSH